MSQHKRRKLPKGLDSDIAELVKPGRERIEIPANKNVEIWVKGRVPGKLYGTIMLKTTRGPKGFGIEVDRAIGDTHLYVETDQGNFRCRWLTIHQLVTEPKPTHELKPIK